MSFHPASNGLIPLREKTVPASPADVIFSGVERASMSTGFFHDERCMWHSGGNYVLTLPVGGFVQPGGGLPEVPEGVRIVRVEEDLGPATKVLPAAQAWRGHCW